MFKTVALICTHNGEKYITDQINSILNQTIPVDEILVHDYNSSDKTVSRVNDFAKSEGSIVRLKCFPHARGPVASFLSSLQLVCLDLSGEVIVHITDQDDYWFPNKNQLVISEFTKINTDATFHDVIISDESLRQSKASYYTGYYRVERDLNLESQNFTNCVIGHTLSIKLSSLSQLDLRYNERIPMHDWYLVNILLGKGMRLRFLNEPLSKYRQHSNNILGANRSKGIGILTYLRRHGLKLRGFLLFQEEVGLKVSGSDYLQVIKSVKPFKKKLFVLTSLFFARL